MTSFLQMLRFILLLGFICVTGVIFIALSIMLGKYELIMLVFIILIGAFVRPFLGNNKQVLSGIPVVGEAIEIYDDLEKYYENNKPRFIVYYVLYPISGLFSYFWDPQKVQKELSVYFNLIKWILLLLIFEGFASYFRIYRYFDTSFALQWFYLELLIVYFLCNFFAIPVAVTALKLHIQKSRKQLFVLILCCCAVFGFSIYHFSMQAKYDNLVTINVVLDKNIAHEKGAFRQNLYEQTKMFLEHHLKSMSLFYYENIFSPKDKQKYLEDLNARFQEQLMGICSFGENDHFFITTTYEWQELWGMVNLPFRDSLVYFFSYKNDTLIIYDSWEKIPLHKRNILKNKWDKTIFELSTTKMFARTMVDNFREKAEKKKSDSKNIDNSYQESNFDIANDQKDLSPGNIEQQFFFVKGKYVQQKRQIEKVWRQFIQQLEQQFDLYFSPDIADQDEFVNKWLPSWRLGGYENIPDTVNDFHREWQKNIIGGMEAQWHEYQQNKTDNEKNKLTQKIFIVQQSINTMENFKGFLINITQSMSELSQQHLYFAVYEKNLKEFDYEKALKQKLVNDHLGKSGEVRKNMLIAVYDYLFYILLKLFEVSMPLHIFFICYSRIKVRMLPNI